MERRKIIIPLDAETAAKLETPHFDAQSTTTARRVVPLGASANSAAPQSNFVPSSTYVRTPAPPKSNNRLIIGLLVLVALLAGALGGLVFGLYQMNSNSNPVTDENETTVQTSPTPLNTNETALGTSPDLLPTATPTPTPLPSPRTTPTPRANSNNANADDSEDNGDGRNNNISGVNQNRNNNSRNANTSPAQVAPPPAPPRPANNNAGANRNANSANRNNNDSEDNGDIRSRRTRPNNNGANSNRVPERILPRRIENTVTNGINRVREIFEGSPRPTRPPR